ncbi:MULTISPECIES: Zn-dependent hydrolase [Halomonadaceae]|uniref:Zn-dependent hydrolase n=2 Tax=Vreelandella TaxID=3137766 RepID=A0A7Z0S0H6_9GAMM|nr:MULTISPECIES: Zn-dependent hydrolase [Halomonas]AJY48966.1 amidase, hydantoinase/carbamoylase family [Halomonas sp. KO116]NYS80461.1 Zn-dependent hydrolase [Halomonas glaciei]|tara:strand:+ start:1135 stop:2391 length:1257 start_codon:yes stop_codon:yes gene_type:complete
MTEPLSTTLRIDGQRLWRSLMDLAQIGATPKGGNCRLALTEEDRLGRELVTGWLRDAGMTLGVDQMGNIFARRAGRRDDLPPVVTGSHLDTQPTGGRFDGCYGVLAGLEVIRVLNDHGITTEAPLEVVIWTNEEGCRFVPVMMGSGVHAGIIPLEDALAAKDRDGDTVAASLERIGYAGDIPMGSRTFGAYIESHIEQGPVLEAEGIAVGAVTGSLGLRWFDVVVTGQEAHAGPTPMLYRRDALKRAAELIGDILALADPHQPHGRVTCGEFELYPNSRNVIPGRVTFSVDIRHLESSTLEQMEQALRDACVRHSELGKVTVELRDVQRVPPTPFDADLVNLIRTSSDTLGIPYRDIETGAGHDAVFISRVAPTAMIFVPCEDGISHNESENATPEDLEAGANVLLHTMLSKAGVAAS